MSRPTLAQICFGWSGASWVSRFTSAFSSLIFPFPSYLLEPRTFKSWSELMPMVGERFLEQLDDQAR